MPKRIYLSKDSTLTERKSNRIVGYLNGIGEFVPYKKTRVGTEIHIMIITPEQANEYDRKIKLKFEKRLQENVDLN